MIYVVSHCDVYIVRDGEAGEAMKVDGKFAPNIINTVVYLLNLVMQTNSFVVNYRGHPFMSSLSENKLLFRGVMTCYAIAIICVFDVFPPISDFLELVVIPDDLKYIVAATMAIDTLVALIVEHSSRWFFETRHGGSVIKTKSKKKKSKAAAVTTTTMESVAESTTKDAKKKSG